MSHLSDKINDLFAEENWRKARALIEKEMDKRGDNPGHWLLARLATTYYEERNYEQAVKLLEKARRLAPHCPLVLWTYSGLLLAGGKPRKAIEVCLSLIKRGPGAVGRDECGEGLEWAVGLLTDCLFRVGVGLKLEREWEKARSFFAGYADVADAGAASIYSRLDLLKQLTDLPRGRGQVTPHGKERSARTTLEQVSKAILPLVG